MNTELTLQWVKKVIGAFSLKKKVLAWESYKYHREYPIKKSLATKKIDTVIKPGGYTEYVQAPHVS